MNEHLSKKKEKMKENNITTIYNSCADGIYCIAIEKA